MNQFIIWNLKCLEIVKYPKVLRHKNLETFHLLSELLKFKELKLANMLQIFI